MPSMASGAGFARRIAVTPPASMRSNYFGGIFPILGYDKPAVKNILGGSSAGKNPKLIPVDSHKDSPAGSAWRICSAGRPHEMAED